MLFSQSLFRATVTGLNTRARDGSEWIVSYVNSSVAGVKARVGALEKWRALVVQQLDFCSRMLEALKQGIEGTNQQSESSSNHSEVLDSIKRMQTRMEQRMNRIEDKIESLETRLDVIEKCLVRAAAQSSVN